MRVAKVSLVNMSRESELRNVGANVGCEMRSQMGVAKVKNSGAYVMGIPKG